MNAQNKIVDLPRAHKFYVLETCAQTYGHYYADTGSRGLPPSTVADMLSAKLGEAEALGKIVEVRDKEHGSEITKIALIEARPNVRCYAVLRRYRAGAHAIVRPDVPGGFAAIAVVSERTGAQCLVDGRWVPMINRPFEKLADVHLPEPAPHVSRPDVIDAVAMAVEQSDEEAGTPRAEPARQYSRSDLEPADVPDEPAEDGEDEHPKSAALRAAAGKLPAGWRSRAARVERESFVRDVMRRRPHIKIGGADGLDALLRARFGMGMSDAIVEQVRAEVLAELEVPVAAEPSTIAARRHAEQPVAAVAASPPATIARKAAPARTPTLATEKMAALAGAFAEATEREKIAKAALASSLAAVRNAEADRDANAESVRSASAECDRLLDLMRAARE